MSEVPLPGGEWKREHAGISPELHLDPRKDTVDPVEQLFEELGPNDAFDDLMAQLEADPGNEELRRQANLLVNRLDDLAAKLRVKVQH